jgi:hypothetical protein
MTLAQRIEMFFTEWELVWASIPGYVKVFLYSTASSAFGLWVINQLDWRAVVIIVATNLGLYAVPREIRNMGR